ncbi:lactate 2-monooxygenase [Blastococcus sp. MG754426]|uniref:alpha-hydroxy-acid oxidizing protein n=1 Tax=unclassified Blastococcus TaxID=2619396 RepID=UPI001EEF91E5|nr:MULTISPECIES: alpha-hydroxy-acid oxidizing protein [unclassified Blastococcus]MCF6509420.1 lactate 2-monooxygenase [Blastococcus sp. MG754426]MCF6513949.1 lactate 2-monooxygenase [Blastococcus sp. MG754427]
MDEAGAGRRRQNEVYRAGVYGRSPRVPVGIRRLQERAKRALDARAYAYVAGGAGDEVTQRANRAAFDRWAVVPRVLRDASVRDTSVELFGRRLPAPLLLGPVGALELVHPEADLAVARAAAATGVPMVFSNQGSRSMEECAAAMDGSPRWFQLYWSTSDELVESLVHRAEKAGCDALVVTLDTTMLGWRPRDLDLGHLPFALGKGIAQYTSDPVFRRLVEERAAAAGPRDAQPRPTPAAVRALVTMARAWPGSFRENLRSPLPRAAVETFLAIYSRPSISWDDLAWLRSRTKLPILLKGVLHPDDARRALDEGMDGVVVSTHGGRQVDRSIAALDALPDVVAAIGDRAPVLLDSGIRSGADVFTAVALGARAVLLGRPFAWGLALAGEAGVRQVIEDVVGEFDLTLGLTGHTAVDQLGPEILRRVG